jgi:hypothetical protein
VILSQRHRYLFIEVPETASWAIRQELCELYDGESVLHKHSAYPEYARATRATGTKPFVFAAVRNPLDCLVSRYVKYLAASWSADDLSDPIKMDFVEQGRMHRVRQGKLTFAQYLKEYYRWPMSEMVDLSRKHLDHVIRYERIQEDFADVLGRLGIRQVRELPVVNKTPGKRGAFLEYYDPPSQQHAARICGPFMRRWGYDFPDGWSQPQRTLVDDWAYALLAGPRRVYMTRLRYNDAAYAKLLRRLRARVLR